MNSQTYFPPYKNVATSLLLTIIFGPVGLLYSSFWGGFLMVFIFMVIAMSQIIFPIILTWVICSIWGVGATEVYNRKNWEMRSNYDKANNPT